MVNVNDNYYNTAQYKTGQGLQNETMQSLASKYGFDFSQNYANQQANAEAQAQKNIYTDQQRQNNSTDQYNLQKIQDDYNTAGHSLDKNYFQQYLTTGQDTANRGLTNSGIGADQYTRLAMNKQSELAGLWKTRNEGTQQEQMRYADTNSKINDSLALVEQQRAANAQKYYQQGLQTGFGFLNQDRSYGLQLANSAWTQYQDQFNNSLDQQKFDFQKQQAAQAAADAAAARANAVRIASLRASASKKSSPAPSVQGSGVSTLQSSLAAYNAAKGSKLTPIQQYYYNPAVAAVMSSPSPLVHQYFNANNIVKPADNPNLSPWQKMKLLGV